MFTNISWTNYLFLVIVLVIFYYIVIGLIFYLDELKSLLIGTRKFALSQSPTKAWENNYYKNTTIDRPAQSEIFVGEDISSETSDNNFLEVEYLIDKLKDAIAEASGKKYIKQEYFMYLQLIMKNYSHFKKTPFQSMINELIITECAKHSSVTFDEDEVMTLWSEIA